MDFLEKPFDQTFTHCLFAVFLGLLAGILFWAGRSVFKAQANYSSPSIVNQQEIKVPHTTASSVGK